MNNFFTFFSILPTNFIAIILKANCAIFPRETGEQTIQIFLLSEDGTIIEGKTRVVEVSKNIKDYLKKFRSIGSLLGSLAVPLAKILPSLIT